MTDIQQQKFLDRMESIKYRILLLSFFLLSVVIPLSDGSPFTKIIHVGLLQVTLLASILAARKFRRLFWVAVGLGVLAFSDSSQEYLSSDAEIHISALVISSLFFTILATTFLYDVLRSTSISIEDISGALCVYLMIGIVWSYLFAIVLANDPHAIQFPEPITPDTHLPGQLTYFSFVTLTTLGYGDITPVSPIARTLCWTEAVLGQIFMTVLVARLVGLNISLPRSPQSSSSSD